MIQAVFLEFLKPSSERPRGLFIVKGPWYWPIQCQRAREHPAMSFQMIKLVYIKHKFLHKTNMWQRNDVLSSLPKLFRALKVKANILDSI